MRAGLVGQGRRAPPRHGHGHGPTGALVLVRCGHDEFGEGTAQSSRQDFLFLRMHRRSREPCPELTMLEKSRLLDRQWKRAGRQVVGITERNETKRCWWWWLVSVCCLRQIFRPHALYRQWNCHFVYRWLQCSIPVGYMLTDGTACHYRRPATAIAA